MWRLAVALVLAALAVLAGLGLYVGGERIRAEYHVVRLRLCAAGVLEGEDAEWSVIVNLEEGRQQALESIAFSHEIARSGRWTDLRVRAALIARVIAQ